MQYKRVSDRKEAKLSLFYSKEPKSPFENQVLNSLEIREIYVALNPGQNMTLGGFLTKFYWAWWSIPDILSPILVNVTASIDLSHCTNKSHTFQKYVELVRTFPIYKCIHTLKSLTHNLIQTYFDMSGKCDHWKHYATVHFTLVCQTLFGDNFFYSLPF